MSQAKIEVNNIKQLPVILGEVDVLKSAQLLPGIQSGGEGNSGLYVRGGGPDQNLILLDEAVVYNAAHLFGFFSVFNADAIKDINIIKGGILTSEICLLDDISRAPGESLNVLLRILNERKYGDEEIPLLTAIATSNPTADEYYNEPLDPANLDRFVIQINSNGLSYSKEWDDVKKIVSLYSAKNDSNGHIEKIGKDVLDESYEKLENVIVSSEVQEGLVSFISWLIDDQRLNESNSVISDRTFLVKSIKIIKANAVLDGRSEANLEDLKALKYILAFRVPE